MRSSCLEHGPGPGFITRAPTRREKSSDFSVRLRDTLALTHSDAEGIMPDGIRGYDVAVLKRNSASISPSAADLGPLNDHYRSIALSARNPIHTRRSPSADHDDIRNNYVERQPRTSLVQNDQVWQVGLVQRLESTRSCRRRLFTPTSMCGSGGNPC